MLFNFAVSVSIISTSRGHHYYHTTPDHANTSHRKWLVQVFEIVTPRSPKLGIPGHQNLEFLADVTTITFHFLPQIFITQTFLSYLSAVTYFYSLFYILLVLNIFAYYPTLI